MDYRGTGMPYRDAGLIGFIQDWWQFLGFVLAGIVAYFMGVERQRWKVGQVGEQVAELRKDFHALTDRVAATERQHMAETLSTSKALTEISTTQHHIVKELEEMKETLRGKVDK